MIVEFIAYLVGTVVVETISGFLGLLKKAKTDAKRPYHGGVRVISGYYTGLSGEWRVAEWHVRQGQLRADGFIVPVVSRVAGSRRAATPEEVPGGHDMIVFTLVTATGQLEWSTPRHLDSLAVRALNVPVSDPSRDIR